MSAEDEGLLYVVGPDGEVHEGLSVEQAARLALEQALDTDAVPADAPCRVCGCTNERRCAGAGGCVWVTDPKGEGPLCSACYVRAWPISDEAGMELVLGVANMSRDPEVPPSMISIRPYEAFLLVSMLQLCLRKANLGPELTATMTAWARRVQSLFAGEVWFLLEQGWHREFDMPNPNKVGG
jgi:hypothetical protein